MKYLILAFLALPTLASASFLTDPDKNCSLNFNQLALPGSDSVLTIYQGYCKHDDGHVVEQTFNCVSEDSKVPSVGECVKKSLALKNAGMAHPIEYKKLQDEYLQSKQGADLADCSKNASNIICADGTYKKVSNVNDSSLMKELSNETKKKTDSNSSAVKQ